MADVLCRQSCASKCRSTQCCRWPCVQDTGCYLPGVPHKRFTQYTRFVECAPYTALWCEEDETRRTEYPSSRYRVRNQVGLTNRWRLPDPIGADMLGSGQVTRAIRSCYNQSLVKLKTAECPYMSPADTCEGRKRSTGCRPRTCPAVCSSINAEGKTERQFVAEILAAYDDISQHYITTNDPDVVLECMGIKWRLHLPFLNKSKVLCELVAQQNFYMPCPIHHDICEKICKCNIKWSTKIDDDVCLHASWHARTGCGMELAPHVSLCIDDSVVTPYALAVVLGNLYRGDFMVPSTDHHSILLASYYLQFDELFTHYLALMMTNLCCSTVPHYHAVAVKCHATQLQEKCEQWLELKLIPELSQTIHLKYLSMEALYTTLMSLRLFTFDEFAILKMLVTWLFLQMNYSAEAMPTYTTMLTYFASASRCKSLLDRSEGSCYVSLFRMLRLHGITDDTQIHDIRTMKILPQSWLVKLLSAHYHAVNAGGDMSLMIFTHNSIRNGFIMEAGVNEKSDVVSLFGFNFELKAERDLSCCQCQCYNFTIQRLKPMDSILSLHDTERQTFSLRAERCVQYGVTVQCWSEGDNLLYDSGILVHRFGLGLKTSTSKVIRWENLTPPLYVTYFMLLPPS